MKQIHQNLKKGEVKVKVENLDDLWYLSTIIEPKDIVKGKTIRKVKLGNSDERKQRIMKKPVFLKISVEKTEFSKTSDILRVSGKITEGPDDVKLGSHHTFSIGENTIITIIKEHWLKHQLDKLSEACSEKTSKILLVVHDREEAYFALMKKYGYDILSSIRGSVQKKAHGEKVDGTFYAGVISQIRNYDKKYKLSHIIIASPAFWKEELMKELKDKELGQKIILATCSSVGRNGINEVLKRPETMQALKQERISKEINAVEKLLEEISKNNLAVYGLKDVENASYAGAVKELLLTDTLIKKSMQEDNYEKIESLMRAVEQTRGSILIISSEHEGGKKLNGLGGIGAILRYKLAY
jgi:protein pelota